MDQGQETTLAEISTVLAEYGYEFRVISIEHLLEVKEHFDGLLANGTIDEEILDKYVNTFNYGAPASFPDAQAVIVVAAFSPPLRVGFTVDGQTIEAIVPPQYKEPDHPVHPEDLLRAVIERAGYRVVRAANANRVPYKRLAVQSGLSVYGRNNITYFLGKKWGSHARLDAFFTDLPASESTWQPMALAAPCTVCRKCVDACPTHCIPADEDRFVVHAGRCLTFYSEDEWPIPDWIDPAWHNCLIGCMYCQNACPMNRVVANDVVEVGILPEPDTTQFMDARTRDDLTPVTVELLENVGLLDDFAIAARNLRLLLDRSSS
jgi:epoxyqueuosine reductase